MTSRDADRENRLVDVEGKKVGHIERVALTCALSCAKLAARGRLLCGPRSPTLPSDSLEQWGGEGASAGRVCTSA